jgi:hypothetical protein
MFDYLCAPCPLLLQVTLKGVVDPAASLIILILTASTPDGLPTLIIRILIILTASTPDGLPTLIIRILIILILTIIIIIAGDARWEAPHWEPPLAL